MNKEQVTELEKTITRDYQTIAGIVILKNGETRFENYFNEASAASQVHVSSVTKSIVSLLIGIAMDKGAIKSIDQKVLDFASEHLFSPLGITVKTNITFHNKEEQFAFIKARNISGWVSGPTGVNTAGWGLTLTAADMARIGQLYLAGGIWEDKKIVSGQWIEESTKAHSLWKERDLPYGYLWWIGEDGYAAMGDGGNLIYVNTRKKTVSAIASLFQPKAKDRIELIRKYIEPMIEREADTCPFMRQ